VENGRVRLLADEELSEDERAEVAALERELLARISVGAASDGGRTTADWTQSDFWRFAEDTDITIVCAPVPPDFRARMPYADPLDPDYVQLYAYADLDSLLELYGHVRAVNRHSQVNIRLASALENDDYTSHLVVLGGVDWNTLTRDLLNDLDLPVGQVPSRGRTNAAFEVVVDRGERQVFEPHVRRDGDAQTLVEDVAHFFRAPNPFNRDRTVTICNGIFGRGVYAAVRSLTDKRFRERNARYAKDRFGDTFSILARARIRGGEAVTPDWSQEHIRLHEWPSTPA
jgi:hypothetical protein